MCYKVTQPCTLPHCSPPQVVQWVNGYQESLSGLGVEDEDVLFPGALRVPHPCCLMLWLGAGSACERDEWETRLLPVAALFCGAAYWI